MKTIIKDGKLTVIDAMSNSEIQEALKMVKAAGLKVRSQTNGANVIPFSGNQESKMKVIWEKLKTKFGTSKIQFTSNGISFGL